MENPIEKKDKRVIVLDTSAFLAGFDPFSISEVQYTVPMVKEEIIGDSMPRVRFKTAVESGKLKVKSPNKAFLEQIKESANVVGDVFFLSETDLQVLALALELKAQGSSPLIVTDDYSIQNVADQLQIKFASLATFGIRFRLQWLRYCSACHRKYSADYKSSKCQICGTELKRKPLRKKLVKS
ncbi:ribonuclease VapC [Candidatus Bathyarchaeota archaeon]|nr:ribonuclease VapC [Candidatus Bathyarchaeota archaeon]